MATDLSEIAGRDVAAAAPATQSRSSLEARAMPAEITAPKVCPSSGP